MGWKGRSGRSCLSCPPLDLVLPHLPGESVPVHPESIGGLRKAPGTLTEDARDEALLEFVHGVVELDASVHHLFDEPFEAIGNHRNSWPVRRRNASTYFSRVFATTSAGREGTGGCLFQRMRSR